MYLWKISTMKKILFILFLFCNISYASEPVLVTNIYTEDITDFPNPERGFYRYTELRTLTAGDVSGLRGENITLIYGKVIADDYTNKPFDSTFFNEVKNGLNLVRTYGLKVNFRLTYYNDADYTNYQDYDDPSKALVLQHIQQLRGIFQTNWDIINVVEAGFIGPWGEWHTSSLANTTDRRDVLTNLLNILPERRMVAIRCPAYKRNIFGYNPLDNTVAFNGSDIARVGFHNDCFLSDDTDSGTYSFGWSRSQEIAYAGGETRYTPFGGESCGNSSYSDCPKAIYEMEQLHTTYLNDGYYPGVLTKWNNDGCMDEIRRRLGYRFLLKSMEISASVKPGGILHIIFHITNIGFAAPYNPRDIEFILDNGTKKYITSINNTNSSDTNLDPRRWLPEKSIVIDKYYRIPYNATETTYRVILNFPDPSQNLHNNPYYSIRLANNNVWESTTGYNILKTNFQITSSAQGSYTTNTNFVEIEMDFGINTPENFRGSLNGLNSVKLQWDANSESNLAGYNIYRKSINDTVFTKINSSLISINSYLDTVNDGIYQYYVTAVDNNSNESTPSDTVTLSVGIYKVLGEERVNVAPTMINLNERNDTYLYFKLERASTVEIKVYDMYAGKKCEYKIDYGAGMHRERIDLKDLSVGVYVIYVKSYEFKKNFKIGVIK